MSLINKMLQDLDKRGSPGADGAPADIRPVGRGERSVPLPVVMGALAGVIILTAGGVYGWRYLQQPRTAPVAVVAPAAPSRPVVITPAEQLPMPETAQPQQVATVATTAPPPPATVVPDNAAARAKPVAQPEPAPTAPLREEKLATPEPLRERNVPVREEKPVSPAPRVNTPVASVAVAPQAGRQAVTGQGAEGAYRRALTSLQDGRVTEAVAQLEAALAIDARHEAARQTLVGILIEQRRTDEAMRLLQAGLALDVRQPAMAMLLARLQIDGGASGIDTLMASLPAAGGNGEYRAFLAGALQRERRHPEAVEQYQAALRAAPENSVWWMGLGISLEAEKRLPEALAAFQRARAAGNLSPELQGFVERKVAALGR
ncbi:tetratricopeptide repeat protein [Massilia scottii]|uniref:tetratricopeptide repeat protein n=1 Tax=Massilia scottii TaxID=3057166 RepID=UPI0027967B95|nr:tetratricopeptide repeat protein [Massilia sp. CCM 9029]MDQ1830322.1 tetratricopeptide repeat protein [Massilia sp. CCM 9029]